MNAIAQTVEDTQHVHLEKYHDLHMQFTREKDEHARARERVTRLEEEVRAMNELRARNLQLAEDERRAQTQVKRGDDERGKVQVAELQVQLIAITEECRRYRDEVGHLRAQQPASVSANLSHVDCLWNILAGAHSRLVRANRPIAGAGRGS